jgi:hypothetical protein
MVPTDISMNSNQMGIYFLVEVLLPHAVSENARWKVLQAPGVRRIVDEMRGGLVPRQAPSDLGSHPSDRIEKVKGMLRNCVHLRSKQWARGQNCNQIVSWWGPKKQAHSCTHHAVKASVYIGLR